MSSIPVSLSADDFVRELQDDRRTAIWVAALSDGSSAYLDDAKPGKHPSSGWLRLRQYVHANRLGILSLELRFRTNHVRLDFSGLDPIGWFFSKSSVGLLFGEDTLDFYIVGVLCPDGLVWTQRWKVPELILVDEGCRRLPGGDERLILNYKSS